MKKNTIFRITNGEYSDYCTMAWLRAEKDFSKKQVIEEYLSSHQDQREPYSGKFYTFLQWFISSGYASEIRDPGEEWHIGSYGNWS